MDETQAGHSLPQVYDGGDVNAAKAAPPDLKQGPPETSHELVHLDSQGQGKGSFVQQSSINPIGSSGLTVQAEAAVAPSKRKRSQDHSSTNSIATGTAKDDSIEPGTKRVKSAIAVAATAMLEKAEESPALYGLKAPLWQRIFGYAPPAILARLLRVSRPFNVLLSPSKSPDADKIWQQSHLRYARSLPDPLIGQSELDMWRLIKGERCQCCSQKKKISTVSNSQDLWHAGPGSNHVRIIWSFRVRICGECLRAHTQTERDLVLASSFPSFLMEGLPHIYLADSLDYVSASQYHNETVPPGLRLVKVYYMPHVENIKRRYDHQKEFSASSAQQWVQSLEPERQDRERDAQRWESWEKRGALAKINSRANTGNATAAPLDTGSVRKSDPVRIQATVGSQIATANVTDTLTSTSCQLEPQWAQYHHPSDDGSAAQYSIDAEVTSGTLSRASRTFQEIQAAKAARREDIERRCRVLAIPIRPDLLEHMEAFRAALQISTMLDETQWQFLKARLEAERPEAERRLAEDQRATRMHAEQQEVARQQAEAEERAKEAEQQRPLQVERKERELAATGQRDKVKSPDVEVDAATARLQRALTGYADQVIHGKWNNGKSLNKESCSQFAAEVLVHVRKCFYDELNSDRNPIDYSAPRILTLENLKWAFEHKVKPLTEQFQKEIFLCNGCENATKAYGFEAVIQHYAAKHTNKLSLGSVVVHWKAEWPEFPPFHPNPMLIKAMALTASTSTNAPGQSQPRNNNHEQTHSANQAHGGSMPQANHSPIGVYPYQTRQYSGQFAPPTALGHLYPVAAPQGLPQYGSPISISQSSHSVSSYPELPIPPPYQQTPVGMGLPYSALPPSDPSIPTAETYRKHLGEMAQLARDLWFDTAGVKSLPGTVRIQVIIYHACERFVGRFELQPGVAMFLDGLNHQAAMRPLRSLNGFSCKACVDGQPGALPAAERKQSTLPHLLNHFKALHAEFPGVDWRRDMVQLPPLNVIAELVNSPGMDDAKFALIAAAFPTAFPYPLPSLVSLQKKAFNAYGPGNQRSERIIPQGAYQQASTPTSTMLGYSGNILPSPSTNAMRASVSPGEDEYDPRRPSYIGRLVNDHGTTGIAQSTRRGNRIATAVDGAPNRGSPMVKQEADADRFLEDLNPNVRSNQSINSQLIHITDPARSLYDRHMNGSSGSNEVAHSHNTPGANKSDGHHYRDTDVTFRYPSDMAHDHFRTTYYNSVSGGSRVPTMTGGREVAYYVCQPDGRLVPAEDRSAAVYYERSEPDRPVYEYIQESREAGFYATQYPSAAQGKTDSHGHAAPEASEYSSQETRVVYVNSRDAYEPQHGHAYPASYGQPQDAYSYNQIYGNENGLHH